MAENIRVLIVDDEERFRKTTAAILERRGFEVKTVASGIEVIEAIRKDGIDVVVLDLAMPGMDGNETLCQIKNIKPDLPVLMLTGHGTPESALEGLREGVFDYLIKPCAVDLLAQEIREALALKGGVSEKEPKVKHLMMPLSSFNTIHEDRTVEDAVDVILKGLSILMEAASRLLDLDLRRLLVTEGGKIVGVIREQDLFFEMANIITQHGRPDEGR